MHIDWNILFEYRNDDKTAINCEILYNKVALGVMHAIRAIML